MGKIKGCGRWKKGKVEEGEGVRRDECERKGEGMKDGRNEGRD